MTFSARILIPGAFDLPSPTLPRPPAMHSPEVEPTQWLLWGQRAEQWAWLPRGLEMCFSVKHLPQSPTNWVGPKSNVLAVAKGSPGQDICSISVITLHDDMAWSSTHFLGSKHPVRCSLLVFGKWQVCFMPLDLLLSIRGKESDCNGPCSQSWE